MGYIVLVASLLTVGQPGIIFPVQRYTPLNLEYASNCALILRTFKGRLDLTRYDGLQYISNFVPNLKIVSPAETCMTYGDISSAVQEAIEIKGRPPREIHELSSVVPKPEHVASAAYILEEATRILAHRYSLSRDAIAYALPKVDTTKTTVKYICPTFLKPVKCELTRYRTLSGMCNNLENPSWGSARSAMLRYLPPVYSDGISSPRRSVDGSDLPSSRVVSFFMHHDVSQHDQVLCNILVAWGQMIDHDLTFASPTLNHRRLDIECCKFPPPHQHPNCMPIAIPPNDPFYKFYNRKCMDFARTLPGLKPGCTLGPRLQINQISAYIDGNFIYGSQREDAERIREFRKGFLKTAPLYRELGLKDLLPMKIIDPDVGCTARPRNAYCFDAGDERVNEQLVLSVMHTIWMREHNRIAEALGQINPHWDDERIYQETRHIIIGELQHITYKEFLPTILGADTIKKFGLELLPHGYYNGYNPKINSGIRSAFQTAAFRFGHSLLPDVTERYNKFHEKLESIRLSMQLRQPYDLYKPGIVDTFLMGLINQESNRMDPEVTTEVTNHLFEKPGEGFGMDLAALNMQRSREHGNPGYNFYREYCGLPKARNFYDLIGVMPNTTVQRYVQLYRHVDDIDLWSAGISEYHLPNAVVGPTFACLIAEQFSYLRQGDRFWYENGGWPSSFTPEQLEEIRKVQLCRVLCENADDMNNIQLNAMLIADTQRNPRVNCIEVPHLDLSKWADVNYFGKK
ncbi:salivary peroxidase/catechol oxidase-like isoform X2 [Tachypleus tridentatus]|uniref:salivary peroxidase/catechol oxidase-like isoform X2 n=1 Tax=Tachypleus tridentatus TaxID=6853 RepID=UPI003FCEFA4D